MYQSIVEGRYVPWSLLVKDMPKDKHHDLVVDRIDTSLNASANAMATQTDGLKTSAMVKGFDHIGLKFKTVVCETNQQLKCSTGS